MAASTCSWRLDSHTSSSWSWTARGDCTGTCPLAYIPTETARGPLTHGLALSIVLFPQAACALQDANSPMLSPYPLHLRAVQVILCSACSGHGFKMCSGIGQLIARMVLAGPGVSRHGPASLGSEIISKRSLRQKEAAGCIGGDDGNDCSWGELLPFRFDAESRPGHREALARFR